MTSNKHFGCPIPWHGRVITTKKPTLLPFTIEPTIHWNIDLPVNFLNLAFHGGWGHPWWAAWCCTRSLPCRFGWRVKNHPITSSKVRNFGAGKRQTIFNPLVPTYIDYPASQREKVGRWTKWEQKNWLRIQHCVELCSLVLGICQQFCMFRKFQRNQVKSLVFSQKADYLEVTYGWVCNFHLDSEKTLCPGGSVVQPLWAWPRLHGRGLRWSLGQRCL